MKNLSCIIVAIALFGVAIRLSFDIGYGQRVETIGNGTFAAKTVLVTNYVYTAKTTLEKK